MRPPRRPARLLATLLLTAVPLAPLVAHPSEAGAPRRVLLIGDSITEGQMSGPPGVPFAEALAPLLGPRYEVVNVACGGTTTVDWSPTRGTDLCDGFFEPNLFAARAVPELPADFVTVMFGTNDSVGFFEPGPIEPAAYRDALSELGRGLLAFDAGQVVLLTPPKRPCTSDRDVAERLRAYREIVLAACGSLDDVVCGPDVFELLDTEDDFAGCDVHPNQRGHAAIAVELAETILGLAGGPAR